MIVDVNLRLSICDQSLSFCCDHQLSFLSLSVGMAKFDFIMQSSALVALAACVVASLSKDQLWVGVLSVLGGLKVKYLLSLAAGISQQSSRMNSHGQAVSQTVSALSEMEFMMDRAQNNVAETVRHLSAAIMASGGAVNTELRMAIAVIKEGMYLRNASQGIASDSAAWYWVAFITEIELENESLFAVITKDSTEGVQWMQTIRGLRALPSAWHNLGDEAVPEILNRGPSDYSETLRNKLKHRVWLLSRVAPRSQEFNPKLAAAAWQVTASWVNAIDSQKM